jgi:hypothetical protein
MYFVLFYKTRVSARRWKRATVFATIFFPVPRRVAESFVCFGPGSRPPRRVLSVVCDNVIRVFASTLGWQWPMAKRVEECVFLSSDWCMCGRVWACVCVCVLVAIFWLRTRSRCQTCTVQDAIARIMGHGVRQGHAPPIATPPLGA